MSVNNASINSINKNLVDNDPKSFPRFWVWYEGEIWDGMNGNGEEPDDPLKFNQVVYNIGDMYNNSTGIVTIPVDGLYQFSTTLKKLDESSGYAHLHIKINDSDYRYNWT